MTVLVTGGGGFLGQAIVRELVQRRLTVRSLSRGEYPELVALGVECIRGDISDRTTVLEASTGCSAIFHVAAKAGIWGPLDEYQTINVIGTENVIAACIENKIPKLIHTSSPSVVFDGHDEIGINESVPYPSKYLAHYPRTKAIAERAVLKANGTRLSDRQVLSTVALRPHLIWGPGDNHLFPRLISRAKQKRLRQVGDGTNVVDTVYIDNAVDAHLLAFEQLSPDSAAAGKPFFISNGEPSPLWQFINRMLACADVPPVTRTMSASTAYYVGAALENVYRVLRVKSEPPMTRFVARQLATSHWFDITASQRAFGYVPRVSVSEGLNRLKQWYASSG